MKRSLFYFLFIIILSSCVCYYTAYEDGKPGYRVCNPKVFRYNKLCYALSNKSLIDTSVIYVKDSIFWKYEIPNWKLYRKEFIRFFPKGQLLIYFSDSIPTNEILNNKVFGMQGYYYIEDSKIKIDFFDIDEIAQTIRYFGRIKENGDLIFYEQTPNYYFGSYCLTENGEKNRHKSLWKKIKLDGVKHYRPDW